MPENFKVVRTGVRKKLWGIFPREVDYHLDIGTGKKNIAYNLIGRIRAKHRLCCEANEEKVSLMARYKPVFCGDALTLGAFVKEKLFDLVTALDVIEHLEKRDGFKLLELIDSLCCGAAVVFTPFGELFMGNKGVKWEEHLSGWWPEDFEKYGYDCTVLKDFHNIKGKFYDALLAVKNFGGKDG